MAKTSTKPLSRIATALKTTPNDVVCFDLKENETRIVRMRRAKEKLSVVAYETTPPAVLDEGNSSPKPLSFSPAVRGAYAGLLYGGANAIVKQINLSGAKVSAARIAEALGLKDANEHRIGWQVLSPGSHQAEASVLAVALPEKLAARLPRLLPSGRPAPFAVSVSPIGILNAFLSSSHAGDELTALLFLDKRECFMAFFNGFRLCLMRRINQGSDALLARIQRNLGVDPETAASMLRGGAIDLSGSIADIASPILRQFALSRDFVERHETGALKTVSIGGDPAMLSAVSKMLKEGMRIDPLEWNSWQGLDLAPALKPPGPDKGWTYTAGLGYARAVLANNG